MTPQYISNVFKKYRDENVKDYIARRKLAQAKALLTGTDLPVREVAARLGYAGEIGIIRLFRKYEAPRPAITVRSTNEAQKRFLSPQPPLCQAEP
ncbi:MAG: helix-turn-helix domain-containing protein [Ruthenibacterium lactatiformans]